MRRNAIAILFFATTTVLGCDSGATATEDPLTPVGDWQLVTAGDKPLPYVYLQDPFGTRFELVKDRFTIFASGAFVRVTTTQYASTGEIPVPDDTPSDGTYVQNDAALTLQFSRSGDVWSGVLTEDGIRFVLEGVAFVYRRL